MRKLLLPLLAAALTLGGVAACGHDDVTYTPAAYGENGHCYYVEDPHEVDTLWSDGRCDRSWTPTLMPIFWHEMYYPYYSSPAYYNRYVPVATRTVYVQHSTTFYTANKSAILTAEKQATYRGSDGKTVKGNKVAPTRFGGGSRTSGSGSRTNCGMAPISGAGVLVKGGGGGSRGGSSGGSRSGGSTSGGTRRTTTTGGC